jgi:3-isopropylmalate dehydrogenase
MVYRIVRLAGDGIGPEIMIAADLVLNAISDKFDIEFDIDAKPFGGVAVDRRGDPFPEITVEACQQADAILLGAVGGPQYDDLEAHLRPEQGLLRMRKELGLFSNIRPVRAIPALEKHTAFKPGHLRDVDIVVMRELTGGIYFGDKERGDDWARDVCAYETHEIERIVRKAAKIAQDRKGKLTSVDKSNVLMTSKLWREVTTRIIEKEFPDIELEHQLVDSMAMKLISDPASYDVVVTENMFGDILTDEASMLAGSIGVLPSASIGDSGPGVFEPIHGSAPDIAGQDKANPLGMIASVAMMLDIGLDEKPAAQAVYAAIDKAINDGQMTGDLGGILGTEDATKAVIERL